MTLYENLVWLHMLLLVLWLGGDLGVFVLGQHFRRRSYSLPERLTLLKLLVIVDLGPRFAWELMVPMSLTLLYFGGYSPDALELCGAQCDVYLMWPETREMLAQRMRDVHARAVHYGRVLDYGLRVHMIVRDTEAEAREYARELVSKLDDEKGREIRARALDAGSLGV